MYEPIFQIIDADYFQKHLTTQALELGEATAILHLTDGSARRPRGINQIFPGYVLLTVFPLEGVSAKSKDIRRNSIKDGPIMWERLAVPYHSIIYVELTTFDTTAGWLGTTRQQRELWGRLHRVAPSRTF